MRRAILTLTVVLAILAAWAPAHGAPEKYLAAFAIDDLDLEALATEAGRSGRISLPVYGHTYDLLLARHSVRSPDMKRFTVSETGEVSVEPSVSRTYRGTVAGATESEARLVVTEALLSGYVRVGSELFFLDPAWRFDPAAPAGRVVSYRAADVLDWPETVIDPVVGAEQLAAGIDAGAPHEGRTAGRVLEIATEADGDFVQANGGMANANDLIEGFVNQLDGLLTSNLGLEARLSAQYASPTPASDPYTPTVFGHGPMRYGPHVTSDNFPCLEKGDGLWEQFGAYWNANRTDVRRDAAVLFSGKDLRICATATTAEDELFGTAGDSPTICEPADRAYVVMERYPLNSAGLMAHELGHSLGRSGHNPTASCPGAPDDHLLCGVVQGKSSEYSATSLQLINSNLNQNGGCLEPPDVELPVDAGATYKFSDPTPPNVARDELIPITNAGATPLAILNPASLVTGACFQQITSPPAVIQEGATHTFKVRLRCASQGLKTGTVRIESDDPDEAVYQFTLRGQVKSGPVYNLRLVATYLPSSSAPAQTFESIEAHPTTDLGYFYDPNLGSFEQRPGGACQSGPENPTYFKLRLEANTNITGCTFQASWDEQLHTCVPSVVDRLNARHDFIINTDDAATDLGNCQLKQPLEYHVRHGEPHSMAVTFMVNGGNYERRVNFTRGSRVSYTPVFDDTYVDEQAPTMLFGQDSHLSTRNSPGLRRYAILKATASGLQGPVRSARLYLDVVAGPVSLLQAYRLATFSPFWGEHNLTWDNWAAQTGGLTSLVDSVGNVPSNSLLQIDLDSEVPASTSLIALGLLLKNGDGTVDRFGSGESAVDKPYVVVTTEP